MLLEFQIDFFALESFTQRRIYHFVDNASKVAKHTLIKSSAGHILKAFAASQVVLFFKLEPTMSLVELIFMATAVPLISCKSISEQYYVTPNDTQTCVNDLVEWCDGMKFPAEGGTISVVSVTIIDSSGYCQAICTADQKGTNCTKNGAPWLTCSNKNQLLYKGKPLARDSLDNTDNSTCETADKAFNDLFVQNLGSGNATLSKELESGLNQLFKAIGAMQQRISAMQRGFFGNWGTGGFPFYFNYPSGFPDDDDTGTSNAEDNREKE